MPVKKIKKSELKTSSNVKNNKVASKEKIKTESKSEVEKNTTKKVVVKRRKTDLKLSKASAVAIVSQANRAKKQALIKKFATSDDVLPTRVEQSNDTKIPLWVWIFFWCSLLLFCITFYHYEICPQIEKENNVVNDDSYREDTTVSIDDIEQDTGNNLDDVNVEESKLESEQTMNGSDLAVKLVETFFDDLSNRKFDEAFSLLIPALQASSEIREHFTSVRMNPFLDWIEGWILKPVNFEYVNSPAYWKDVYKFNLSYEMSLDHSNYDEIWEFTINTQWDEPKISSMRCVTSKCSYHPIFWPENFWLMR